VVEQENGEWTFKHAYQRWWSIGWPPGESLVVVLMRYPNRTDGQIHARIVAAR